MSEDEPHNRGPATTPAEFGSNLLQIIKLARARGAQVVLVSPFANRAYPASAGPLLSPFFKIIGSPWRLGDVATTAGEAATLIRHALYAQEQGHYEAAARNYNTVLSSRRSPPWLLELASNNLAVLLHDAGRCSDAERRFASRASAGHAFSSIATYNLARLLQEKGRHAEAGEWFERATEQDRYLFRIKNAYRVVIAEMAAAHGGHLLDLATILTADMFVDYCHPTAEAHNDIASALFGILSRIAALPGDQRPESRYQSCHPSPNAFEHCDDDLLDYFHIAPPVSTDDIETEVAQITVMLRRLGEQHPLRAVRRLSANSAIQRSIAGALTQVTRHPLITCVDDLCRWPIQERCELGTLPEHYIYRLILCYLDWAFAHGINCQLGDDDLEGTSDLRPYYSRLMIARPNVGSDTRVNLDASYRRRLCQRVLAACQADDLFRDHRAERLVTVLRWYMREAFRYGTQSRIGMLYPAAVFDSIVEALRVWVVIARFDEDEDDERLIRALYCWLRELEHLHRRHARLFLCQRYSASEQDSSLFRRELLQWKDTFPTMASVP